MKKFTSCFIAGLMVVSSINLLGQNTFEKHYYLNLPFFLSNDGGIEVEQTSDSGYIILTEIDGSTGGHSSVFVETDMYGDTLQTSSLFEINTAQLVDFCLTDQQEILAVGYQGSWISYALIAKLNSDFDTLWTQSGSLGGIPSIIETMDNNYVMAGSLTYDYHMSKISADGDSIWTKQYNPQSRFYPRGAFECIDSSLILYGKAESVDDTATIIKTDMNGNQIWMRSLPDTTIYAGCKSDNENFVVAAKIENKVGVIKFNSNGEQLWCQTYEINSNGVPRSICQGINNEYLLTADPNYLTKIDHDGNLIWSQTYGDRLRDAKLTNDSLIVATGVKWDPSAATYLIKTDQDGLITSIPTRKVTNGQSINIYPNPSSGLTMIVYEFSNEEELSLQIHNINGRLLEHIQLGTRKSGKYELDCSKFPSGIYFITLKTDEDIITEKIIIE